MNAKPENVEQYLANGCGRCERGGTPRCKVRSWTNELTLLRTILGESNLIEEIKWGAPCYTFAGKNVLMLSALKECVVVSFFQGARMIDSDDLLEKPGEHSQFARYIRFSNTQSIAQRKTAILTYVEEAIELEESAGDPPMVRDALPQYPDELTQAFAKDSKFATAFQALTPGRQRAWLIHFTSAKQSKTRTSRIQESRPNVLKGKGWNER